MCREDKRGGVISPSPLHCATGDTPGLFSVSLQARPFLLEAWFASRLAMSSGGLSSCSSLRAPLKTLRVRVMYHRYCGPPVMAQDSGYDRFPRAANSWRTIHLVLGNNPITPC
jgi:hypothetical protein